jgi:predicted methyltransferase
MNHLKATTIAFCLALAATGGATAMQASTKAAVEAQGDAITDPSFKREDVLKFVQIKPGDRVADIVAGRFTRALSVAVGPKGKVYAVEPAEVVKAHPPLLPMMNGLAAQAADHNIEVLSGPISAMGLPSGLDAVFIRQNYHDLHDRFMGPADVPAFNRAVYAALKPGGVFVVLDHAAAKGSGLAATDTLHRIDSDTAVAEVLAAGFKLDGQSDVFANPADTHDKNVFDPSIRGHTDQFMFRFRKPK